MARLLVLEGEATDFTRRLGAVLVYSDS